MKTPRSLLLRISATVLLLGASCTAAEKKVVAYLPNWIDLSIFAQKIDYEKLTHINVAFENPIDEQGTISYSRKNDSLIATAHRHEVKVLVSIGGGAASGDKTLKSRYFSLLSNSRRSAFVDKVSEYVTVHDFDGLDVDIEGPSINDDYGAFIAELAVALKARGKLLTAALSKGYGGDKVPDTALSHFDFVNIMAYDAAGPWSPASPGQHSSLEFAKSNVTYWLNRGLSKDKAVLGVPFYGYGFGNAFRRRDYPYSEIVANFPGAENEDQTASTIWYNGISTIQAKVRFVKNYGLAGIMIWSLDYDVKGPKSLLSAIYNAMRER